MYTRILTFHNLTAPHPDGAAPNQWCTYSHDDVMAYLLNDNRCELAHLADINIDEDIHFDSEADCHAQASSYYTNYNQAYPYMKEWKASLAAVVVDSEDVYSQVMEFE